MRETSLGGPGACQVFVSSPRSRQGRGTEKERPCHHPVWSAAPLSPLHEVGQHPNLRQVESPTPLACEGGQGRVAGAALSLQPLIGR